MIQQFPPGKNYREGNLKTSFIYLLIDPRISDNLPGKSRVSYYLIFTLNKFLLVNLTSNGMFYKICDIFEIFFSRWRGFLV